MVRTVEVQLPPGSRIPLPLFSLRRMDTVDNREFWDFVAQSVKVWEEQRPDWSRGGSDGGVATG